MNPLMIGGFREFILPGVFHTTNMKNVVETMVRIGFFGPCQKHLKFLTRKEKN